LGGHPRTRGIWQSKPKGVFEFTRQRTSNQKPGARNQQLETTQSNIEGEIINLLQAAEKNPNTIGVIINAGGYSHTSVAISDTIRAMSKKVIAVHISNTFDREVERHKDLVAAASDGFIGGFGLDGYRLALVSLGVGV